MGVDVRELIPDRLRINPTFIPGAWRGEFASTPALITDEVYLILPDVDKHAKWGPAKWAPRVQNQVIDVAQGAEPSKQFTVAQLVLPVAGNQCLVMFDNLRFPWVVTWWPA